MRIVLAPKLLPASQARLRCDVLYAPWAQRSSIVPYLYAVALLTIGHSEREVHSEFLKRVLERASEALDTNPTELSDHMRVTCRQLIDFCRWRIGETTHRPSRLVETKNFLLTLPPPEDPSFEQELANAASVDL